MGRFIWVFGILIFCSVGAKAEKLTLLCDYKDFTFTFGLDTEKSVILFAKDGFNNLFQENLPYKATDSTFVWRKDASESIWAIDRTNLRMQEIDSTGEYVRRVFNCRRGESPL
jgi:hypothetical protein